MEKNRRIRVLLCSPYGRMVGGISRWTGHVLDYYSKNETDINLKHYYSNGKGAYQNTNLIIRLYIGIMSYIPFLLGLISELKKNKYDAVHFTSSASISLIRDILSLKIAKNKCVKTVIHFRFGRIPQIYQKQNWEKKLLNMAIKLSDKVIVIDQQSYRTLLQFGHKNIEILANPLSPIVNEIIQQNSEISKLSNKLVFAGHVITTKGVFELVKVCKEIDNVKLVIVGYSTQKTKDMLLKLAGANHNSWLEFAGELSMEETIKVMLSAGIFVLPTYTEGFPNVILESMACGCPIVTTKVGAIPEMLDIENGENYGLCVEPKNVEQLKNAILRMLNDRDFAKQCGVNAKKRVNELYSMPIVWNQMVQIWKSIIE